MTTNLARVVAKTPMPISSLSIRVYPSLSAADSRCLKSIKEISAGNKISVNKLTTSPEVKSKIGKLDIRDFDEDAARTLYQIAYEAKIDNSVILAEKILEPLKNRIPKPLVAGRLAAQQ